jgi:hypothetical protein
VLCCIVAWCGQLSVDGKFFAAVDSHSHVALWVQKVRPLNRASDCRSTDVGGGMGCFMCLRCRPAWWRQGLTCPTNGSRVVLCPGGSHRGHGRATLDDQLAQHFPVRPREKRHPVDRLGSTLPAIGPRPVTHLRSLGGRSGKRPADKSWSYIGRHKSHSRRITGQSELYAGVFSRQAGSSIRLSNVVQAWSL